MIINQTAIYLNLVYCYPVFINKCELTFIFLYYNF